MSNIIPIVDAELQKDRDEAVELARQIEAGEVETIPFSVADHLDTREVVVEYIKEFLERGSAQEIDEMLKDVAQSKYVMGLVTL